MSKIQKVIYYFAVTIIGFLWAFPFLWMLNASFSTMQVIFSLPPKLGDLFTSARPFRNYIQVLTEYNFFRYTLNTAFVTLSASVGQLITCSLAGFGFATMEFRGKNVLFGLFLMVMSVPIQVVIIPEFLLMMHLGWLDTWLPLIVPSIFVGSLGTFLMRTFFESIPQEIEDSAIIDGAGPFRLYWNVFLPQAKAPLTTLFILAFVTNWNQLLRPILYINSRSLMTLPMALTRFQGQYQAEWNLLLTGSVITVVPLIVLFIFLQRYVIQGMTRMGIKG